MHLIIYHGVFGGWGWEALDDDGAVACESDRVFDTREECEDDARRLGLRPADTAELVIGASFGG